MIVLVRSSTFLVTFIVLLLTYSCGSQRTFQKKPPSQALGQYEIIQIQDLNTTLQSYPPDILWSIPNQLAEKLEEEKLFIGVSRSPVDLKKGVLILDGTLRDFTPKDWYKQLVTTGKIVVDIRFVDKADNNVIADATFEGTAKWGLLGGGMIFADHRLISEIVKYIKLNYVHQAFLSFQNLPISSS
ncbi:MAG TPA: hypothetical protein VGA95_04765 [Thermodesulfobacteriota bacterium]